MELFLNFAVFTASIEKYWLDMHKMYVCVHVCMYVEGRGHP